MFILGIVEAWGLTKVLQKNKITLTMGSVDTRKVH